MSSRALETRLLAVFAVVLILALVLGLVAKLIGAEAKDILTIATAVAGLATVAVGLGLSIDAFKLLYDKERAKKLAAQRAAGTSLMTFTTDTTDGTELGPAELVVADAARASATAAAAGTPFDVSLDLNELLPKLVRTAAGLAIAVLLLGTLMLVGASFSTPEPAASPSPGASSTPAPTPSPTPLT